MMGVSAIALRAATNDLACFKSAAFFFSSKRATSSAFLSASSACASLMYAASPVVRAHKNAAAFTSSASSSTLPSLTSSRSRFFVMLAPTSSRCRSSRRTTNRALSSPKSSSRCAHTMAFVLCTAALNNESMYLMCPQKPSMALVLRSVLSNASTISSIWFCTENSPSSTYFIALPPSNVLSMPAANTLTCSRVCGVERLLSSSCGS